ncbi:uncharacterized protein TNCV_3264921 [Trichonephila clavipes]|nr:uncharacterized protein TNCV_3264921 [Trichonephila clavipes]
MNSLLPVSDVEQSQFVRRSFEPFDQMLFHRMVLEPHMVYPIPAGIHYILLLVQKTVFGLDIIPESILHQLMENGFNVRDFRKMKRYDQKAHKLPPPIPAHVPAETNKRPLVEQFGATSPQPVIIPEFPEQIPATPPVQILATPTVQIPATLPVQIPATTELTTSLVQIPDPPVQIPVFQPPGQKPHVPTTPPVQMFFTRSTTCADSLI